MDILQWKLAGLVELVRGWASWLWSAFWAGLPVFGIAWIAWYWNHKRINFPNESNLSRKKIEILIRAKEALIDFDDYDRIWGSNPRDNWDILIDHWIVSGLLWGRARTFVIEGTEPNENRLGTLITLLEATPYRRLEAHEIATRSIIRGG